MTYLQISMKNLNYKKFLIHKSEMKSNKNMPYLVSSFKFQQQVPV